MLNAKYSQVLLVGCVKLCACSLVTPVWPSPLQLWHFSIAAGCRRPGASPLPLAALLQSPSRRGSAAQPPLWTGGQQTHSIARKHN